MANVFPIFSLNKRVSPQRSIKLQLPEKIKFSDVHSALTTESRILISDELGHRIFSFAPDGKFINATRSRGTKPAEFNSPRGMAYSSGKLYVCDSLNHRIQVLDQDTHFIDQITNNDFANNVLIEPFSLAVIEEDYLAIACKRSDKIHIISPSRELAAIWKSSPDKTTDAFLIGKSDPVPTINSKDQLSFNHVAQILQHNQNIIISDQQGMSCYSIDFCLKWQVFFDSLICHKGMVAFEHFVVFIDDISESLHILDPATCRYFKLASLHGCKALFKFDDETLALVQGQEIQFIDWSSIKFLLSDVDASTSLTTDTQYKQTKSTATDIFNSIAESLKTISSKFDQIQNLGSSISKIKGFQGIHYPKYSQRFDTCQLDKETHESAMSLYDCLAELDRFSNELHGLFTRNLISASKYDGDASEFYNEGILYRVFELTTWLSTVMADELNRICEILKSDDGLDVQLAQIIKHNLHQTLARHIVTVVAGFIEKQRTVSLFTKTGILLSDIFNKNEASLKKLLLYNKSYPFTPLNLITPENSSRHIKNLKRYTTITQEILGVLHAVKNPTKIDNTFDKTVHLNLSWQYEKMLCDIATKQRLMVPKLHILDPDQAESKLVEFGLIEKKETVGTGSDYEADTLATTNPAANLLHNWLDTEIEDFLDVIQKTGHYTSFIDTLNKLGTNIITGAPWLSAEFSEIEKGEILFNAGCYDIALPHLLTAAQVKNDSNYYSKYIKAYSYLYGIEATYSNHPWLSDEASEAFIVIRFEDLSEEVDIKGKYFSILSKDTISELFDKQKRVPLFYNWMRKGWLRELESVITTLKDQLGFGIKELLILSTALLRQAKYDESIDVLDGIHEVFGPSIEILNLKKICFGQKGDIKAAKKISAEIIKIAPDNRVKESVFLINAHINSGELTKAMELVGTLLIDNPYAKMPLLFKAKINFISYKYDEVISLLEPLLEDHPLFHQAVDYLVQSYAATGQSDKALNLIRAYRIKSISTPTFDLVEAKYHLGANNIHSSKALLYRIIKHKTQPVVSQEAAIYLANILFTNGINKWDRNFIDCEHENYPNLGSTIILYAVKLASADTPKAERMLDQLGGSTSSREMFIQIFAALLADWNGDSQKAKTKLDSLPVYFGLDIIKPLLIKFN